MKLLFSVEHVGLACRDTVAMKEWYCSVLGAEPVFAMKQTPPAFILKLGGLAIELYASPAQTDLTGDNRTAGWRHLALKVENLDEARSTLEAKGVMFTHPVKPAGGGGRVLFFSDPEGNLFHLVERLPGGFS